MQEQIDATSSFSTGQELIRYRWFHWAWLWISFSKQRHANYAQREVFISCKKNTWGFTMGYPFCWGKTSLQSVSPWYDFSLSAWPNVSAPGSSPRARCLQKSQPWWLGGLVVGLKVGLGWLSFPKSNVVFQPSIFRGENVSFRELKTKHFWFLYVSFISFFLLRRWSRYFEAFWAWFSKWKATKRAKGRKGFGRNLQVFCTTGVLQKVLI